MNESTRQIMQHMHERDMQERRISQSYNNRSDVNINCNGLAWSIFASTIAVCATLIWIYGNSG